VALSLYAIFRIFFSHASTANADFNNDGTVDVRDLTILAAHFRQTSLSQAQGDADGNGTVDIQDYSILALEWGTNPSAVYFGDLNNGPADLAAASGRVHFDTVRLFAQWTDSIMNTPGGNDKYSKAVRNGLIPIISWSPDIASTPPVSWVPIYDGDDDAQIYQQSQHLQTFPGPVYFIFQHEPTTAANAESKPILTPGDPGYGKQVSCPAGYSPQSCDYVAAYKHIHDIFTCAINPTNANPCKPADNLIWVWDMAETPYLSGSQITNFWNSSDAAGWYPGDSYVDWVAAEDFFFACKVSGTLNYGGSNSFLSGATPFYEWATDTAPVGGSLPTDLVPKEGSTSMPLMIPAFGTDPVFAIDRTDPNNPMLIPNPPNDTQAASWITAAASDLETKLPRIRAVGYYDSTYSSTNTGATCPATISSSLNPAMFNALAAMAANPYFNH